MHADHITGSGELKKESNYQAKSIIGEMSGAEADIKVKENDRIEIGSIVLKVFSTPGKKLMQKFKIVKIYFQFSKSIFFNIEKDIQMVV